MEHQPETAMFLNMVMIEKGEQVLVENRRKQDWPGITFPGGHVESHESFVDSAVREIREETGLKIAHLKLAGMAQYNDITADNVYFRRVIYFYRTKDFSGELKASREGEVYWLDKTKLADQKLSGSMADFLPVIQNPELSEVFYLGDGDDYQTFFK